MKTLLSLCVPALVFSMFTTGCHIETHHDDDQVGPDGTQDTCGAFCLRLFECSSISGEQMGACLDTCDAKLHADSDATISACECVQADECRALDAYDCAGAPFPTGGSGTGTGTGGSTASSGGTASSTGGGGASSSGGTSSGAGAASGGSTPLGCQGGYECGDSEDCVEGACRQRCTASCQCPTDLSCIDHYCRSAVPPPMCATDCECASGQHCISGSCG